MSSTFYLQPHIQSMFDALADLRQQHKTIVLVTGVFDLFHKEHKNFLRASKQAGDVLVVALESDKRTRELKGKGRPLHLQDIRRATVAKLPEVDFAFILPEDFNTQEAYEELITQLKPHIYAVSSHSTYLENKQKLVEKHGGVLKIVHQHNPTISTTQIIAGL